MDRVMINTSDPTKYLRMGRSATPCAGTTGTIVATEASIRGKVIISVIWDTGAVGKYILNDQFNILS